MGWLFMSRDAMGGHATPKAYLDAQCTWDRTHDDGSRSAMHVLASACSGNRVYYAAVEPRRDGVVGEAFAVVSLVRWHPGAKSGEEFGYKDMDENMGPCEAECPSKILALLGSSSHPYALDWRRRCLASLRRRRRTLAHGQLIRFAEPLSFTDGHSGTDFRVEKRDRRLVLRDPSSNRGYHVTRLRDRRWTVVADTRFHSTLFA